MTVYGVLPEVTGTKPKGIFLNVEGYTTHDTTIDYSINPPNNEEADRLQAILEITTDPTVRQGLQAQIDALLATYNAVIADIDLYEREPGSTNPNNDKWLYSLPGSATSGEGTATIIRGTYFNSEKEHYVQVVLNKGSDAEVRGEKTRLLTRYCNQVAVTDMLSCPNREENPNWIYQYDGCSKVSDNPAGGFLIAFSNSQRTGTCDQHDRCYQTCWADDLNAARLACDDNFLSEARLTCLNELIINPFKTAECLIWAETYYIGLRADILGGNAFRSRQKEVCICCK